MDKRTIDKGTKLWVKLVLVGVEFQGSAREQNDLI